MTYCTPMLSVLRRQLEPTFQMIADVIDKCPESSWIDARSGRPLWQQVLHALIGIQFWFRESSEAFIPPDFGQGSVPDLDEAPTFEVSKDTVRAYMQTMHARAEAFFDSLDDRRLLSTTSLYDKFTYGDLILGQIRHIQHHVGYCGALMRTGGAGVPKWKGHGE
jgi:uncharacterized damage-inducible protein DinB